MPVDTSTATAASSRAVAQALRAVGHPARLTILAVTERDGRTSPVGLSRQIADYKLAALAHHVRVLASAGLLRADGTTPRRGASEHHYVLTELGRSALAAARLLQPPG